MFCLRCIFMCSLNSSFIDVVVARRNCFLARVLLRAPAGSKKAQQTGGTEREEKRAKPRDKSDHTHQHPSHLPTGTYEYGTILNQQHNVQPDTNRHIRNRYYSRKTPRHHSKWKNRRGASSRRSPNLSPQTGFR